MGEYPCSGGQSIDCSSKCPWVRPIELGESLRRLMGKTVGLLAGEDVHVCGSDQLCTGADAGIEAVVHDHAVNTLF